MIIDQISVKLKNQPGEMSKVSDLLGDEGINIRALTLSLQAENGLVHLILDDPAKGLEVLKGRGYETAIHQVIAVETPDHPGGLNALLRPLKDAKINVEFLYPLIGRLRGNAVLIVGAEPITEAILALQKHYITILDKELFGC